MPCPHQRAKSMPTVMEGSASGEHQSHNDQPHSICCIARHAIASHAWLKGLVLLWRGQNPSNCRLYLLHAYRKCTAAACLRIPALAWLIKCADRAPPRPGRRHDCACASELTPGMLRPLQRLFLLQSLLYDGLGEVVPLSLGNIGNGHLSRHFRCDLAQQAVISPA